MSEAPVRPSVEDLGMGVLFWSMPESIVAVDLDDGRIVHWNPASERLFGYTADEATGMPVDTVLPGLRYTPAWAIAAVDEAAEAEHWRTLVELDTRLPTGDPLALEITLVPVRTALVRGRYVIALVRDTTARKRLEAERDRAMAQLDAERARLEAVLRQMPAGVVIAAAPSGRVLLANQQAEPLLRGLELEGGADGAAPRRFTGLRPDGQPYAVEEWPLARALRGEAIPGEEIELVDDGGWRAVLNVGAVPIRDEDGDVVAAVATFFDVTARRDAEREVERRADELARSNAELEQFAYVASHDLQEPLRVIVSFLQLLERRYKGQLDDRADQYIAFVVDAAERMKRLINDLLAYSRVGRAVAPFGPVDMERTLADALAALRSAVEQSGAQVTHGPLPSVLGDANQLAQLLQNLVANGVKFHGAEPPRVHVAADRRDSEWVFSVTDNGIGVSPEFAERIFVMFQRLHTREEYPGTGIGLAICKKIVERHGGRIWVEPAPGGGARFCFTIPADGGPLP